jgi:NADH:ubiquinone oxidoreductase subunit F (NADH-binding)
MTKVFVPLDMAAKAMGADKVAAAIAKEAQARGQSVQIVRNGSRGLLWLESLVEVETPQGRIAYGNVTAKDVASLFDSGFLGGAPHKLSVGKVEDHPFWKRQHRVTFKRCGITDPLSLSDYESLGGGVGLAKAFAMSPAEAVAEVTKSGLRGRGGAGFPTGIKWKTVADTPADRRYVVVNADEGDSGTFADRMIMEGDPFALIEGMIIAGYAVNASKGYVYLRSEYPQTAVVFGRAIEILREAGWLGPKVRGSNFAFDVELRIGAGAYVCGEETALIESLEGKRGVPRIRPPFPVTHGYLGRPTSVNNVETLALATLVAAHGGETFTKIGTPQSTGTKLLSISGDCAEPGVYEFPFGVTFAEVLAACGAERPKAVQHGGAAGITIAEREFGRRVAFEDAPTAGAFMVFGQGRDMFEVARNFVRFFAHESCGFCTPCRIGTTLLRDLMQKLEAGHGSPLDLAEIERLNHLLQATSHCGLGQAAANPVLDGMRKFRPAFDARMLHKEFQPAFSLDAALGRARQMTGRDDALAHLTEDRA